MPTQVHRICFPEKAIHESIETEISPHFEISLETRYLRQEADLTEYTLAQFFDDTLNLYYFTSKDQRDVVLCKIELYNRL